MTISRTQVIGSNNSKTAGTTLAVSLVGGTKPVKGDLIIVACARDDIASDPLTGDSCTDTLGNSYVPVYFNSTTATNATAADGVIGLVFVCLVAVTWPGGTNTVTWTMPSVTARGMKVEHYTSTLGRFYYQRTLNSTAGQSTTGAPTCTSGTLASGYLALGLLAVEGSTATTPTADADTTNGSWTAFGTITSGTSGGTANTNVYAATEPKVVTGSGTQTFNPSVGVSTDCSVIILAFSDFDPTAIAKHSTVTDDFSSEDPAKWTDWVGMNTLIDAVGGQLRLNCVSTYPAIYGSQVLSLIGSSVSFQCFADGGNLGGAVTRTVYFQIHDDTGTSGYIHCYFGEGDGAIAFEYYRMGVYTAGTYVNPTSDTWIKISEASGTITLASGTDGKNWTTRSTLTFADIGFVPEYCYVDIGTGHYGAEAEPYYIYVDNYNLTPSGSLPPMRQRMLLPAHLAR